MNHNHFSDFSSVAIACTPGEIDRSHSCHLAVGMTVCLVVTATGKQLLFRVVGTDRDSLVVRSGLRTPIVVSRRKVRHAF